MEAAIVSYAKGLSVTAAVALVALGGPAYSQTPTPFTFPASPKLGTEDFAFRPLTSAAALVRGDGHIILSISNSVPSPLLERIHAAGYSPGQVDTILLNFAHRNNIDGLVRNGTQTFPNATIYVDAFWLTSADDADRAYLKHVLAPYVAAGKVNAFDKNMLILPHITAHARYTASEFTTGSSSFQMNFPKLGIVGSDLFTDD
ncbi:hypothetical protein [Nitrospirillum amazonense]|nr:hypothetical protein [Nitrospirillum amazonense]